MTIRLDTLIPFGCNSRAASVGGLFHLNLCTASGRNSRLLNHAREVRDRLFVEWSTAGCRILGRLRPVRIVRKRGAMCPSKRESLPPASPQDSFSLPSRHHRTPFRAKTHRRASLSHGAPAHDHTNKKAAQKAVSEFQLASRTYPADERERAFPPSG